MEEMERAREESKEDRSRKAVGKKKRGRSLARVASVAQCCARVLRNVAQVVSRALRICAGFRVLSNR